jgi:hypothetical protein
MSLDPFPAIPGRADSKINDVLFENMVMCCT